MGGGKETLKGGGGEGSQYYSKHLTLDSYQRSNLICQIPRVSFEGLTVDIIPTLRRYNIYGLTNHIRATVHSPPEHGTGVFSEQTGAHIEPLSINEKSDFLPG